MNLIIFHSIFTISIKNNVNIFLKLFKFSFSFYATKIITSGGNGGMVISKNRNLIDYIRDFRDFDMKSDNKLRFNFSITDIQSSIGIEQLKKLPKFIKRRSEIFEMYRDAGFNLIDSSDKNILPVRFRAVIIVENPIKIINKLKEKGIDTIIPIKENELISKDINLVNSLFLSRNTLSLPIYPSLDDESVKYIIKELRNLL